MRYFAYMAEQAFRDGPGGERLFYRGGPWSRPYVIPDAQTERRLFSRQLWMMRLLFGGLILGQPFVIILWPQSIRVIRDPLWFLSYLAAVIAVFQLVTWVVFRGDLRDLARMPGRLSLAAYFASSARRHGIIGIAFGLLGSLMFVAGGVAMVVMGFGAVGATCVAFFSLAVLGWGYTLYLKLRIQSGPGKNEGEGPDSGGWHGLAEPFEWLRTTHSHVFPGNKHARTLR